MDTNTYSKPEGNSRRRKAAATFGNKCSKAIDALPAARGKLITWDVDSSHMGTCRHIISPVGREKCTILLTPLRKDVYRTAETRFQMSRPPHNLKELLRCEPLVSKSPKTIKALLHSHQLFRENMSRHVAKNLETVKFPTGSRKASQRTTDK